MVVKANIEGRKRKVIARNLMAGMKTFIRCNPRPAWSTNLEHYRFAWIAVHQNPFRELLTDIDKMKFAREIFSLSTSMEKWGIVRELCQ